MVSVAFRGYVWNESWKKFIRSGSTDFYIQDPGPKQVIFNFTSNSTWSTKPRQDSYRQKFTMYYPEYAITMVGDVPLLGTTLPTWESKIRFSALWVLEFDFNGLFIRIGDTFDQKAFSMETLRFELVEGERGRGLLYTIGMAARKLEV